MNDFLRLPPPKKKSPQQNFPSPTGGISPPTSWNYLENPAMSSPLALTNKTICPTFYLLELDQMSIKNFWELIGKK